MADTSEMTVTALIGGSFKFPKESEPISAAYVINISNSLLKPVKVDIQHCANVLTQEHINYLSFATAPIQHPCQFQLEEGGLFSLDHHYGSIYLSTSSIIIIVKSLKLNAESKLQDQDRSNEMYLPTLQSNYFVSKLTYFSKSATFDEGIIEYPVDSSKNKKILSKNSVEDIVRRMKSQNTLCKNKVECLDMLIHDLIQPHTTSKNVSPHPDTRYAGLVVYEPKCNIDNEWLMHFMVAKRLTVLLEYIKAYLPPTVEKDAKISFSFINDDGYIELIIKSEEQTEPFKGWCIRPHQNTVIQKCDVDTYGFSDDVDIPSVLITVSAEYVPNMTCKLQYYVPLKGITPKNDIYIVRTFCQSLTNNMHMAIKTSAHSHQETRSHHQDSIDHLKRKCLEVFNSHSASLCECSENCIKTLASHMKSENMINDEVAKSEDFKTIQSDFKAGVRQLTTHSTLEDHCVKFINICTGLGGPICLAALRLKQDWIALGMELKTL